MTATTEAAPAVPAAGLCETAAYFRDEAAELLRDVTSPTDALALVLGHVLWLHARVTEIEAMAEALAEIGSKGLGGLLGGMFTRQD